MLITLYEKKPTSGRSVLTPALREFYGELSFPIAPDRPYVIGNFVKALDGPVTFGKDSENPLFGNRDDRLVMSMLRSLAGAVIVGKDTLLDDPANATWHWKTTVPKGREHILAEFAASIGLRVPQKNVFVSATGAGFDFSRDVFHDKDVQAVIATTTTGEKILKKDIHRLAKAPRVEFWVLDDNAGNGVDLRGLIAKLWQEGTRFVLLEGGPALYGGFEALDLVDEIFLSQSPIIVGNGKDNPRPTFSGTSHPAGQQKKVNLVSIKKGEDDMLFSRWRYSSQ